MNTYYYLIPEAARKLAIGVIVWPLHTDNRKFPHKLRLQSQWRRVEQHEDWRFL